MSPGQHTAFHFTMPSHLLLGVLLVLAGLIDTTKTAVYAQAAQAAPMLHVSQCRLCHRCHLGESPPPGRRPADLSDGNTAASADATSHANGALGTASSAAASGASASPANNNTAGIVDGDDTNASSSQVAASDSKRRQPEYDPELDPTIPIEFKPSSYLPQSTRQRRNLPVCSECYGCLHNLTHISDSSTFMNNTYSNEAGATSSWIFRANTNVTRSGEAVVKLYCLPLPKRPGAKLPQCRPARTAEVMRQLMAVDKLAQECGFTDIVPRMWLAPVRGVVPGIGFPIDWWGLWMEYVDGISLENFIHKGKPKRLPPPTIAGLLNDRLNRTRVLRAAVFDLLTSQCDRHAQNIFIQEDGNIVLIDNEACLQHMWLNCGFDSVLVPTTQKQEIVRLANHFVLKLPSKTTIVMPKGHADPQLLLDYRCNLPPQQQQQRQGGGRAGSSGGGKGQGGQRWGELGTAYPPDLAACLKRIADMTPRQVRSHFGFPDVRVATNLHTRATDMITRGFEWAAKYGAPQNAPPKRYRFQPPCCRVKVEAGRFACAHPWEPRWELPLGNPITGKDWDKDRPDPGTYPGGTWPEDE
ncbi:hypothetical protein Agub_g11205, partial [Astrephomene gubernaculifera]